jgi:hypothetical protein
VNSLPISNRAQAPKTNIARVYAWTCDPPCVVLPSAANLARREAHKTASRRRASLSASQARFQAAAMPNRQARRAAAPSRRIRLEHAKPCGTVRWVSPQPGIAHFLDAEGYETNQANQRRARNAAKRARRARR